MYLIPLKCQNCGNQFSAGEKDVVFYCSNCRKAWEVKEGRLSECPVIVAKSAKVFSAAPVFLPFWQFRTNVSAGNAPAAIEVFSQKLVYAWVTGFFAAKVATIGDPGMVYTSRSLDIQEEEAGPVEIKISGCVRDRATAEKFATVFIMQTIDRRMDISEMDIEVKFLSGRLVGVPFFRMGDRLFDGLVGLQWPISFADSAIA